ncbi:hypothetical protein SFRURICE_006548 [Spodoptera frugiperda]|nr:hypothetical protein SFRURICE_006548 [Spodoptera frugiperda]
MPLYNVHPLLTICVISPMIFFTVVGVSSTHDTQTRNNDLWITQRVVACENRTRYTLHGSQLPSHRDNSKLCSRILRNKNRIIRKIEPDFSTSQATYLAKINLKLGLHHWSSGRKCDCRTRGLGFDSRIGQIAARSLELCTVYGNSLPSRYMGIITLHAVMCTSAYPFGVKKRYVDLNL